jgi:hypothetical protein
VIWVSIGLLLTIFYTEHFPSVNINKKSRRQKGRQRKEERDNTRETNGGRNSKERQLLGRRMGAICVHSISDTTLNEW